MTDSPTVHDSAAHGTRRLWAVLSYRSGENTQIMALARELEARGGWDVEIKRLGYRPAGWYNLLQRVGLHGIRRRLSAPLSPPWPDLVISAGLRNEPPCRWIRRESAGQTRVVFLGRSWVSPDHLDLLVTTPQYRVPPHPRVLENRLTLHRISPARLQRAADKWQATLSGYPRRRIGVLLGGSVGPYVLGRTAVDRLAQYLNNSDAASVLISTSSRTGPGLAGALAGRLAMPTFVYEWQPDDDQNPYTGILAVADELVVSGDSIAMLSEAVGTGKPVWILDLGAGVWSMGSSAGMASSREDLNFGARFYRGLMRFGHRRWTRDITLVHRQLVAGGQAGWLGETIRGEMYGVPADMDAAVARIEALWPDQDSASRAAGDGSATNRPSTIRYTRSETSARAD
jgi:mitochondrial fission protein ELM1